MWKRGDAVQIGKHDPSLVGVVMRVAKDGVWADVLWISSTDKGDSAWTKRQLDATKLRRATSDQRELAAIFFTLQEAVAEGYLERVPSG